MNILLYYKCSHYGWFVEVFVAIRIVCASCVARTKCNGSSHFNYYVAYWYVKYVAFFTHESFIRPTTDTTQAWCCFIVEAILRRRNSHPFHLMGTSYRALFLIVLFKLNLDDFSYYQSTALVCVASSNFFWSFSFLYRMDWSIHNKFWYIAKAIVC